MDSKKMKKTATKIAKQAVKKGGEAIVAIEKAARPRIKAMKKAAAPKVKQMKEAARGAAKTALTASAKKLKKAAKSI